MSPKAWSTILIVIGAFILISNWTWVTDRLVYEEGATRPGEITIWSHSGDPQRERRLAAEFMEANPDVNVAIHFRESGSLGEVIFVSFLSGSPPDLMDVPLAQLREYIADGMVRPMDDLLEAELERNPDYLQNRRGGELEVFRWTTNPNDYYIRNAHRYPEQAARLLNMHDRVLGFTNLGFSDMLTFNRRIFREAAEVFPEAGLVDNEGEPVPPATWSELLRVARVITEYGRTLGEDAARPYGIIIQGQRPRDIMRGLAPLAAVAGSRGFDFAGDNWVEGIDRPVGRYAYDDDAFLGALALFLQLQKDGSVLPGTAGRHFEEPRTLIGEGRAAMLIEGWHAAHRAAVTVPLNRHDIGSAPIPRPDEAFAERFGLDLGRGALPADIGQGVTVFTSGVRHPEAAWRWLNFNLDPERQRMSVANHITLPQTRDVAEKLFFSDAPEAVAWREENVVPFQPMAWRVFETAQIWPVPPAHGPVRVDNHESVLHGAFHDFRGREGREIGEVLERTRERLRAYSRAVNADLAERVRAGGLHPAEFTFPDWEPANPEPFFKRQRTFRPKGVDEEIADLRAKLPATTRDLVYGFARTPGWPHLAAILALILATVLVYLGWQVWQDMRARRTPLARVRAEARECRHAYVFVFPAILSLFAFILYPSLYQLYLAVHSGTGLGVLQNVGLEHFRTILFEDDRFWREVIPNTAKYMFLVAAGEVVLGLALALVLVLPLRANRGYRILFFIPLVTSLAAISIIFFGLLAGTDSTLNNLLFHVDGLWQRLTGRGFYGPENAIDFLNNPAFALYTVIGVAIWSGIPFNTIICMAGLQSVPPELYEAAKVDGAGPLRRFIHVTMPQMLPILVIIVFNSLVGAARHFGTVYIMTEGERGTEIASTYIFKWGFVRSETQVPDIGYASALGLAYALLLGVFVVGNVAFIAHRWKRRLAPAEPEAAASSAP